MSNGDTTKLDQKVLAWLRVFEEEFGVPMTQKILTKMVDKAIENCEQQYYDETFRQLKRDEIVHVASNIENYVRV